MRVLLDNCIPRRLDASLKDIDVTRVLDLGWAHLNDRELLDAMAGRYNVLVTVDRGIRHQQRLHDRPIAVAVLRARTNRLADLLPLIPALRQVLGQMRLGEVHEVGGAPIEVGEPPIA